MCGEAIDVPEITAPLLPVPTPVERMLTPGAAMSGLSALDPLTGPFELKLARLRKPGLLIVIAVVPVTDAAATRLSPSAVAAGPRTPRTPRNGIVTSYASPV